MDLCFSELYFKSNPPFWYDFYKNQATFLSDGVLVTRVMCLCYNMCYLCCALGNFKIITQNEWDSVHFQVQSIFGCLKTRSNFYTLVIKHFFTKKTRKSFFLVIFSGNFNLRNTLKTLPLKPLSIKAVTLGKITLNTAKNALKMVCYSVLFWRNRRFLTVL